MAVHPLAGLGLGRVMLFNVAATCHMWFYMQQLVEQIKEHITGVDITRNGHYQSVYSLRKSTR